MPRTKNILDLDLWSENFDAWFATIMDGLTEQQRLQIPDNLYRKLFTRGKLSVSRLRFMEKAFVISRVLDKPWTLSIESASGISQETFRLTQKAKTGVAINQKILEKQKEEVWFVLADRILMQSMGYLSHVLNSDIFNVVKDYRLQDAYKHKQKAEVIESYNEMITFLNYYEGSKKLLATKFGLTQGEWYVLLYFAQGERKATDFYNAHSRFVYSKGKQNLRVSLYNMHRVGLVEKRGAVNTKYRLSSRGQDTVNEIIRQIFLNY